MMSVKLFKSFLIVSILFFALSANCQISGVKYLMERQSGKPYIDVYLMITEGSAATQKQRAQFGSQISIITPKSLTPKIAKTYMPITDNQEMKGTIPCDWQILSKTIGPSNDQDHSYFSITPVLSPSSFYNKIKAGDKIKLFTIEVEGNQDCIDGVRFFDNETDAGASVAGMKGADFVSVFCIGGIKSIYKGNLSSKNLIALTQKGNSISCNSKGTEFVWYNADDNSQISTTTTPNYKPSKSGNFYVVTKTGSCTLKSGAIQFNASKK